MLSINGVTASMIRGLEIEQFSLRSSPGRQYEITYIPGRDTPLVERKTQRDMVSVTISADLFWKESLDDAIKWFYGRKSIAPYVFEDLQKQGKVALSDSDETTHLYRIGEIQGEIAITPFGDEQNEYLHIEATYLCEPFLYSSYDNVVNWDQSNNFEGSGMVLFQEGTVDTFPTITIHFTFPNVQTLCAIAINRKNFKFLMPGDIGNYNDTTVCVDGMLRQIYTIDSNGKKESCNYLIQEGNWDFLKLHPCTSSNWEERNVFDIDFYQQASTGQYTDKVNNPEFTVELKLNPRWL